MALGASVIAVLIVLAALAGYLRFAPKFAGREETARPLPPGARPRELVRQAAQIRYTPPPAAATPAPAAAAPAPATAPATDPATAPATDPATAEGATAAAEASAVPTAGPESEPAVQADATGQAEAAAPEPRPSAKTAEEVGAPTEQAAPTAPAAAPAAPAPAAPAASGSSHGAQLDQETFDRVLEEQLGKGVDRRVAEGRARAAAVVAARKKAEG
jgi:hypothetical protein